MQYTLRKIPVALDSALRRRAAEAGTSLNEAAIEAMARGLGFSGRPERYRELVDLAGTWIEDPEFDSAIEHQDQVDEELWR